MACKTICKLCDRLIISDSVTFVGGTLVIDIPAGAYADGCKYCIVVAQAIPEATTINAPVAISIGGVTTTLYPLVGCDCAQVTACGINTRTKYSTVVSTTPTGGSFKLLGKVCCRSDNNLAALGGVTGA